MALGVGIGYLLGRSHKMRLALMVAAAGAAGKFGGSPGALLQRGLSASPELAKMTDTIRGELVGAVKSAALSATSNRIDSLSDRIRHPHKAEDEEFEPPEDEEDEGLQDNAADQDSDEGTDEPERPVRRARRSTTSRGGSRRTKEEPDEDTAEPARPAKPARRSAASRTTSRRTKESDSQDAESDDSKKTTPRRRAAAARSTSGTGRTSARRTRR